VKVGDEYVSRKTNEIAVIDQCNETHVKATVRELLFIGKIDLTIEEFKNQYAFTGENKLNGESK